MRQHIARIAIFLLLPLSVSALNCFVCGDNNLDEFGECSSQFQYDCANYAARFSKDERIYCRTTRSRAKNNTYTVMKECISEQDHYRTFPEKGYPLDEECDLVDVQGEEVAYCVCRHNTCNKSPIADQFMAFEEKHPELFGDADLAMPHVPSVPTGQAPLGLGKVSGAIAPHPPGTQKEIAPPAAFGTPQLVPQAIVPVNDPRFSSNSISTADIRRTQLPARTMDPHDIAIATDSHFNGAIPPPVSEGRFVGSMGSGRPKPAKTVSLPIPAPAPVPPMAVRPAATAQAAKTQHQGPIEHQLRCTQCGQTGLPSESSDCERQVTVDCQLPNSICFTRLIMLGEGKNAVEKMCTTREALVSEYGESAAEEGCSTANEGRVRYCSCAKDNCNQGPISQQVNISPVLSAGTIPAFVQTAPQIDQPKINNRIEKPSVNPLIEADEDNNDDDKNDVEIHNQPHFSAPAPDFDVKELVNPQQHLQDRVGKPKPIVPVKINNAKEFRCAVCSETDITDPTADCKNAFPIDCNTQNTAGEELYCLTRQTQMATNIFAMEKRCVTPSQFALSFPDEQIKEGCATAFEGIVNYCICKDDMCNQQGLLQQAQATGVRVQEGPKPTTTTTMKVAAVNKPPKVFLDKDEPSRSNENTLPDISLSEEERELMERRRQWAEADLNHSSQLLIYISFIISLLLL